jgi:hypothetical protein
MPACARSVSGFRMHTSVATGTSDEYDAELIAAFNGESWLEKGALMLRRSRINPNAGREKQMHSVSRKIAPPYCIQYEFLA